MAKKEVGWLICEEYRAITFQSDLNGPALDLVAASGNTEYHLQVVASGDKTALVQKLLRKMAELWPAFDFEFQANSKREITDVKM